MAKKSMNFKDIAALGISIIGVSIGLFFMSPNLTGNVISNISEASGWIGAIIIIASLLLSFFILWKK